MKSARKNPINLAAIDIGSNAARLLIKTATFQEDGSVNLEKQQFIRFPLRLGVDVFQNGKISEEREEQFLCMIKAFKQFTAPVPLRPCGTRPTARKCCAESAIVPESILN